MMSPRQYIANDKNKLVATGFAPVWMNDKNKLNRIPAVKPPAPTTGGGRMSQPRIEKYVCNASIAYLLHSF